MMNTLVLLGVPLVPLFLAVALAVPAWRDTVWRCAPWAALPALVVALAGWPADTVSLPWLLVGTRLGLDETSRVFLVLTAGLWLAAGHYASAYHAKDPDRLRHLAAFLVTQAGNLLLVVAADAVTFYLGFLTMSLAAYGLIVHTGTDAARRAGAVYLVLVVLGEALILPALWLAVAGAESLAPADLRAAIQDSDLAIGLLLAGLGVKAALIPLHVWLPLAHPEAPTPASAVLSGAMVKAGLLGWLTLLPAGDVTRPDVGIALIVLGLAGAFGAALYGCVQSRPKAVLAYSTVSQMGLMIAVFGMAWYSPEAAVPALAALVVYAVHHGFAKGALFLGVGCVEGAGSPRARRAVLGVLFLPALALAGAPLTSGAIAKGAMKETLPSLPAGLYAGLEIALPLAAIGTTLLMARFLWLAARLQAQDAKPGLFAPWAALCAAVAVVGFVPVALSADVVLAAVAPSTWWAATWPVLAGLALAAIAVLTRRGAPTWLPEGDVLWLVIAIGRPLVRHWPGQASRRAIDVLDHSVDTRRQWVAHWLTRLGERGETALTRWPLLMATLLATLAAAWLLVRV